MMRAQGIQPCPIFDLPGVGLDIICIDVLHCLDLGFTQDVLGNIFLEYLASGLCPGANQDARVKSLWEQLKVHQKKYKSPTKLQGLTMEMIKQPKKPPKLRAKGAETRILLFIMMYYLFFLICYLLPFLIYLLLFIRSVVSFGVLCASSMYQRDQSLHNLTVLQCISGLFDFYMLLSLEEWVPWLKKIL